MSHDPFAPPRADLDVPPEDRGPPPRRVVIAVGLAVGSFVLGLLMNLAFFFGAWKIVGQEGANFPQLVGALAMFALYCALAWKIRLGRNWARIVFLVITVLGLFGLLSSVALLGSWLKGLPSIYWALTGSKVVIEVAAAVLLFTGEAKAWFRP